MTPSSDAQPNTGSAPVPGQGVEVPRLFHFDLPPLEQTSQPFPEQTAAESIHRVLDIASGNGEWAIAAAQALPQIQVVGIERNAQLAQNARAQAEVSGVSNATFTVMDPFGPLDLPDGTFDLVNARYIVGLLEASAWPRALAEYVRVSRAGGVIRLTENDLPITSGVALEKLSAMIGRSFCVTKRSFSPSGRLLSVTPMLKRLLQDAGCQDVRQVVWLSNFSAGMPFHAQVTRALAQQYQLVLPLLVSALEAKREEVEQLYQQMLAEMQSERFSATGLSLTVWGTKP